jgi:hypothetical protein
MIVSHRDGGAVSSPPSVGSFKNADDRRLNNTNHRHDFTASRNISTSFDPKTLVYNTGSLWFSTGCWRAWTMGTKYSLFCPQ